MIKDKYISIIIPAYNSEKYISETLDSIFSQTYNNFEIIAINDGSTDDTLNILKDYQSKHNNMKVIDQFNYGQSHARNRGIDLAEGKYIAFIDSDDIVDSNYLDTLLLNSDNGDADIVICGYEEFKGSIDNIIYKRIPSKWVVKSYNNTNYLFHYSPCAKIFKTSFLKEHNIKFSEGEQLEDGPFNIWAGILSNKTNYIDYLGYKYRNHNSSTMSNIRTGKPKQDLPYKAIEELIKNVQKEEHDKELFEYTIIKELAGLCTNVCKNIDKDSRYKLCDYCNHILKTYFSNCKNNKYLSISKLKNISIVHRLAVKLFICSYNHNCLYLFSAIVSKLL